MNQAEFNEAVSIQLEKLSAENKALKKQLAAVNPELLAEMKITMDAAQSMHSVMQTERKQMAEQSMQSRKEFKEEQEAVFARLSNAKNSVTAQVNMVFAKNAETEAKLEEMRQSNQRIEGLRDSLLERQDWVMANIDTRMNDLDTRAGKEYIKELFDNEDRRKNNAAATEIVQREIRNLLSNPSGMNPEEAQE